MNKLSYLKKNHVEDCMIDDEGMTLFADFLVHNVMLSDLHISGSNLFITEVVGLLRQMLLHSHCLVRCLSEQNPQLFKSGILLQCDVNG